MIGSCPDPNCGAPIRQGLRTNHTTVCGQGKATDIERVLDLLKYERGQLAKLVDMSTSDAEELQWQCAEFVLIDVISKIERRFK